jgi:hypothetical protein
MNALMIALTMSLAEGSEALPLRMSLFNVEAEAKTLEVPAPSFTSLVVAFDLPSYAELNGVDHVASPLAFDATETRPWTAAPAAPAEAASSGWLKDWSQR